MSIVAIIPSFGISFSLSLTFLSGFNSCGFFGRFSGKKGESITITITQMAVRIGIPDMSIGKCRSSDFNVNFARSDNSVFVGNSVSVGNSSVKKGCSISVAKTKTISWIRIRILRPQEA
jgi:hypothetical protein